jgi:hypothetical protein
MSALTESRANCADLEFASLIHNRHGKGAIKRAGVSPDAWIQMCIQLAFYRLHKRFVHTYESGSARFYAHGRTETIRVVSRESCAFVRGMDDSTQSVSIDTIHALPSR